MDRTVPNYNLKPRGITRNKLQKVNSNTPREESGVREVGEIKKSMKIPKGAFEPTINSDYKAQEIINKWNKESKFKKG